MSGFNVIKKRETDAAMISLCSDGIIRVMIKKEIDIDPSHLEKLFKVYNELVEDKKFPFLYYSEDSTVSFSEEGRAYAKEYEFAFPKVCNAIIVNNLAHKLIANFYLKFSRPEFPFKVFNKFDEAEKWCQLEAAKIASNI